MRRYETVVVLSVTGGEQELKEEIKRLETFLSSKGAKAVQVERAGTRELGYKMKKQSVGHYVYFKFDVESAGVPQEIESYFRIDEAVLKFETHRIGVPQRKFKGRTKAPGSSDSDDLMVEGDLSI